MPAGTRNQNLYEILGLDPEKKNSITAEDIKKAYKKKALETHPDKNPNDLEAAEKFKAISNAYNVLGDPAARSNYDNPLRFSDFMPNFRKKEPSEEYQKAKAEEEAQEAAAKNIQKRYSELKGGRAFIAKLFGGATSFLIAVAIFIAFILLTAAIPFIIIGMFIPPFKGWLEKKLNANSLKDKLGFTLLSLIYMPFLPIIGIVLGSMLAVSSFKQFCLLADLYLGKIFRRKKLSESEEDKELVTSKVGTTYSETFKDIVNEKKSDVAKEEQMKVDINSPSQSKEMTLDKKEAQEDHANTQSHSSNTPKNP